MPIASILSSWMSVSCLRPVIVVEQAVANSDKANIKTPILTHRL
jgi:hypothetical protein